MQWKLPFSEYFESDKRRLTRISSEYSPKLEKLVEDNRNLIKSNISEKQMNVINRFPSPFDTMDQNWDKMEKLLQHWSDKKQVWPLSYNMQILSTVNGLSSFYICRLFRKSFKLADGKTALMNSYIPGLVLPLFFGPILHYKFITSPITSGVEGCQVCRCLKAGLIQSITSSLYPLIYGSISSLYFADYFMMYATPDSIKDKDSRRYLYQILLKSVKKNKIPLISISILNFIFAYYLTLKEEQTIEFMYFSLLKEQTIKTNTNK